PMPTENRSSNTEMVSDLLPCPFCGEKPQITKHHREDIYSFMHRCQVLGPISWGFREDQQAHIEKWNARAQPAPQPHAEPIAWMVGTAFWWTKEEAERDAAETGLPIVGLGPMAGVAAAQQHQGEPVALPARKDPTQHWVEPGGVHKAEGWNSYHDEIAKLGPLYTRPAPANSAEVEREPECFCVEHGLHIETLRAQLAEAHALLRDLTAEDIPLRVAARIEAALSASAEQEVKS
ncbi:Lar family restriction alleviation protein, partial [Pseudomonas juntendi]